MQVSAAEKEVEMKNQVNQVYQVNQVNQVNQEGDPFYMLASPNLTLPPVHVPTLQVSHSNQCPISSISPPFQLHSSYHYQPLLLSPDKRVKTEEEVGLTLQYPKKSTLQTETQPKYHKCP